MRYENMFFYLLQIGNETRGRSSKEQKKHLRHERRVRISKHFNGQEEC
jgi:hypothetical protein